MGDPAVPSAATDNDGRDEMVVSVSSFTALAGGSMHGEENLVDVSKSWVIVPPVVVSGEVTSSSVQVSGEDCGNAPHVGVGCNNHHHHHHHQHPGQQLTRSISTGSDTTTISNTSEIPSDTQDTNSQPTGIAKTFKRKYLLRHLTDQCGTHIDILMKVAISSEVSKRCAHASLTVRLFPYVQESSWWPERYSYIQIFLTIPKPYLIQMTVANSCQLMFILVATAQKPNGRENELLVDEEAVEIAMSVPRGESVCHSEMVRFIQHTKLIDTVCSGVKVEAGAYFKLTPRRYTIPEYGTDNGYVNIDAPPMDVISSEVGVTTTDVPPSDEPPTEVPPSDEPPSPPAGPSGDSPVV